MTRWLAWLPWLFAAVAFGAGLGWFILASI
jgi:hypothetical protein